MSNPLPLEELHVVMFPFPAFGHISPFVQLSNQLSLHGVRVSFFAAPGSIGRIRSYFLLTPRTQIIPLSIPPVEGLPPGVDNTSEMTPAMADLLKIAIDLMQPQIKALLSELKPNFVFFDFNQHWLPKLASELGIKTVWFSVFSAISVAYLTVPARFTGGAEQIPTVEDLLKPPNGFPKTSVTSIKAFQAKDLLHAFLSIDGGPSVIQRVMKASTGCTAVVIKTCKEMESPYLEFMKSQLQKPLFLTGPLVPEPSTGVLEDKWATWLGRFPSKSVIFCSFGSETFLQRDQIRELALGLELTGLPFILVLNFPPGLDSQAELAQALPSGFLERVKNRAMVHTGWVQQQLILAHDNVGCYLCHSGFSSVVEAIVNDCQLVLLPFKGDQFFNSKLIAGDMKAGVEVNRRDEGGHFGREDINEAVKTLMVDTDKEPCHTVRSSHKKWREFLLNKENQDKFIADLVADLKATAMGLG